MHTHPLRRSRAVIEVLESRQLLSATIEPEIAPSAATMPALTVAAAAVHQPSLLHTQADFDRMATKVAAGEQPWLAGWNALIADGYAQLGANPRPLETVIRGGTGQNFAQMW